MGQWLCRVLHVWRGEFGRWSCTVLKVWQEGNSPLRPTFPLRIRLYICLQAGFASPLATSYAPCSSLAHVLHVSLVNLFYMGVNPMVQRFQGHPFLISSPPFFLPPPAATYPTAMAARTPEQFMDALEQGGAQTEYSLTAALEGSCTRSPEGSTAARNASSSDSDNGSSSEAGLLNRRGNGAVASLQRALGIDAVLLALENRVSPGAVEACVVNAVRAMSEAGVDVAKDVQV